MAAMTACPFLMFQGRAEEAMNFYVSLFEDGKVLELLHYEAGDAGPAGTVKRAAFTVAGLKLMCIDSPIEHGFSFTPSMSIFVTCTNDNQIQQLAATLAHNGSVLMPLADYGFSAKFAWVSDRFGVSWQLNLE